MIVSFRRTTRLLAVVFWALPAGGAAQALALSVTPPTPSWWARADGFLSSGDPAGALAILEPMLQPTAPQPEVSWRAARAWYQMGILATEQDSANAAFRRAVAHAEAALAAGGPHPEALRWAVAANGSVANAPGVGPRETARTARRAWELTQSLLEVAPDDPVGHSAMGSLHAEVLTMNRVERFLARAFLGGMVNGARWDDALAHHRRAVDLDPNRVLYRLELGKALGWRGDLEGARTTLEAAVALLPLTPVDRVHQASARTWLQRFSGLADSEGHDDGDGREPEAGVHPT